MHEDELWTPIVLCKAKKIIAVDIDFYFYRQREGSVMQSSSTKKRLDAYFIVTDRLMGFAGRFGFSGEDGVLKNWFYVNIFWLYYWAFSLLPKVKDSSYKLPVHHLESFWRDCWEMMPVPQKICRNYFRNAEARLKKYIDWRISDWVASIEPQKNAGKKLMLIYNMLDEDLSLKLGDVPVSWVITTDRRYLQQADAIVFYLPDLQQELECDLEKPQGQTWVSWYMESEKNKPWIENPELSDIFDLWMCFPQDEEQKEHPLISLCRKVDEILFNNIKSDRHGKY